MIHLFQNLYLSNRFFFLFGGIILVFLLGFAVPFLFPVALGLFALSIALAVLDISLLFNKSVEIDGHRIAPKLVDELPVQFQVRDFEEKLKLPVEEAQRITYKLRPLERGVYAFGKINIYLSTTWNLVERRIQLEQEEEVPVYPSIIQMKQMELQALDRIAHHQGIKK